MAERTVSRVTLLNEAGPTSQHKASFFRKKNPLNRRLGAMAPAPPPHWLCPCPGSKFRCILLIAFYKRIKEQFNSLLLFVEFFNVM